jgi:hypothetical protein
MSAHVEAIAPVTSTLHSPQLHRVESTVFILLSFEFTPATMSAVREGERTAAEALTVLASLTTGTSDWQALGLKGGRSPEFVKTTSIWTASPPVFC